MSFSSSLATSADSLYVSNSNSQTISGIAAVVNGEMISLHDLQMQASPEISRAKINANDPNARDKINAIQHKVLDAMIVDLLAAQEAERYKIVTSDDDVEAEIKKILESNKISRDILERSLAAQGLSLDFLKTRIRRNLTNSRLMQLMVTHKVVVPFAEIEKYYNENKDQFFKNRKIHLKIIAFSPSAHEEAAGIVNNIKLGKLSFEQAAKQYSVGPNPTGGGDLGERDWAKMSSAWRKALKGIQVGEISPLFRVDENDIVLKVVSITGGEPETLKEAEPEIDMILKEPLLQERFKEYIQQLRDKAVIDIRL